MAAQDRVTTWVVVSVERGIPTGAFVCRDATEAEQCERGIRSQMNELEDETGVFEIGADGGCTEVAFPANRRHLGAGA